MNTSFNATLDAVPTQSVRKAFGGAVVLKCDHDVDLAQVFSCWNKTQDSFPDKQVPCPPHILKEDTCPESVVHVHHFA